MIRSMGLLMVSNQTSFLGQKELCRHVSHKLTNSGNPYETKIRRLRPVQDPSYPDFEKQECLKWSTWTMLRDVKRRLKNSEYWQYRMNLQNIGKNYNLPNLVRDIAIEERNLCPRDSSIVRVNNRCAISSRGRGKFYRYKLSRIVWRDQADHGMLSGPIRAKWG